MKDKPYILQGGLRVNLETLLTMGDVGVYCDREAADKCAEALKRSDGKVYKWDNPIGLTCVVRAEDLD